jgi:hypothetical protein
LHSSHPNRWHAIRSYEQGVVENVPEFRVVLRLHHATYACDADVSLLSFPHGSFDDAGRGGKVYRMHPDPKPIGAVLSRRCER